MASITPFPADRSIVLIGFMGAGKSTVARSFAKQLGLPFEDSDELLVAQFGTSIEDFFDAHGEAEFRRREEALNLQLLGAGRASVIALGGGAIESAAVRSALRRHIVVWRTIDIDAAWQRAQGTGRPLARDQAAFAELFVARQQLYEQCANAVIPADCDFAAVVVALRQLANAKSGTLLVWAVSASGSYPVFVGAGALSGDFWLPGGRAFCVSDQSVWRLYGEQLPARTLETYAFYPGEAQKTLTTAERAWSAMVAAGLTRADYLLALGGGVVGDLAGFCAATYQRGVRYVQLPTTLVAQVDSAFGGKTGVDLPTAKNYVGAYHQPSAVVVDPTLLRTLSPPELAAGYAEVVKTALIAGGELWQRVRSGATSDTRTITQCLQTKLAVVAADERDSGCRQVLNLGHTVGHAIETVTGYSRYRHGEAVALGMLATLRLSGQDALRAELAELWRAAKLPTTLDQSVSTQDVLLALGRDKKRISEKTVPFVLVKQPGDVTYGNYVGDGDITAAIKELQGS